MCSIVYFCVVYVLRNMFTVSHTPGVVFLCGCVMCASSCAILDRARSFVGTAEYVSPELLKSKVAFKRCVQLSWLPIMACFCVCAEVQ